MIIRSATVDDASGIGRVHVLGWQVGYRHILPAEFLNSLSTDDRRRRAARRIADPAAYERILVAVENGVVRGFAGAGSSRDADASPATAELMTLYIDPDRWGRGVGRRLQRQALETLAGEGFAAATLWVLAGNERARAFYERTGWVPDGRGWSHEVEGVVLHEVRYRRPLDSR